MNIPFPSNELERVIRLSEYDLDYSDLESQFKDLTKLAAKVAGTEISLINLIDSFTQWSVSTHGIPALQMPREDSVCTYTIMGEESFEIRDLTRDERFNNKFYVTDDPNLTYYWGIPLKDEKGFNLGALCVMDKHAKDLSPEKVELLKIIADEIVNRLKILLTIQQLKTKMNDMSQNNKRVAHDIRGPLGGIIGLAQVIKEQGNENSLEEVLEFIHLIQKSGKSLLELADDILSENFQEPQKVKINPHTELNLELLKGKLLDMYGVQAKQKEVNLSISLNQEHGHLPFNKNKMLQVIGNLISNAIKFTSSGGDVSVNLDLEEVDEKKNLSVVVRDTGKGLSQEQINQILDGNAKSMNGTGGETGFGFGLPLVKHLVESMQGKMSIKSVQGQYSQFEITLPA
ncbi:histidine kinase response regulator hybrid protein [Indibacter alkaliphilus LW1]|uniref:histidine kinase n=1 Tax=Indibacter alkaliphilus (strain CCUG 57479 / KCTC 22604 / LW1) TaxID=1189612 RepID=S2DPI2_INDAL|nr:GAF domain-containing sensor histidine kinase [Indibacter alkaliphilus]EOZ99065.1 histidine kinase response regulator hybrid protein [Indibacter alkaliphilus LW1]